jgi:nitrite reductase (NADH) large subunit
VLNAIELPENPDALILPAHASSGKPSIGVDKLPDSAQICSCFDVTKGMLISAINKGCHTVAALKAETKAGTGCGGCIPLVTQVLNAELAKQGIEVNNNLCEHFAYSRQELYHLIRVEGIKSFDELLAKHGQGYGCEVCKPTVGSLLASCWNEYVLKPEHAAAGHQRQLPGQHPERRHLLRYPALCRWRNHAGRLVAVGRIAREFNLYTKITGSQRIGLFGAQKDDLPEIWRQLIEAGFETGHAYAKALRMAKTCVGSTWCRYGVGDSVGFGVELENRYKGIRTPHKMKFGVSGCTRECAEAQGKDVGIIATEKGWNLYVCGNGGMKPRHADLLAADLDRDTLIQYLDRFMMFYIRTADKLTRTAPGWTTWKAASTT